MFLKKKKVETVIDRKKYIQYVSEIHDEANGEVRADSSGVAKSVASVWVKRMNVLAYCCSAGRDKHAGEIMRWAF